MTTIKTPDSGAAGAPTDPGPHAEGALELHRSERISATQYGAELGARGAGERQRIALHVRLPFCPTRCLNCKTNATITHDHAEIDRYLDSLEREIDLVAERLGATAQLSQLYVGGGSPNYLRDAQLVRLMEILDRAFIVDASTEMTVEANARQSSASQLELLNGLGFTQISFSVSDLDPLVQMGIGRNQSVALLHEVFATARQANFETITTDLMYGLPHQSTDSMRRTIESMIELAPDRIKCLVYQRRTDIYPHQLAMDAGLMPSLADKLALLNVIVDSLTGDNYAWIGLDCFMRNEDPLRRAHADRKLRRNWLGYTLQSGDSLLGLGTHAVSEIGELCVRNHAGVARWSGSLQTGELPIHDGFRLSAADKRYRSALSDLTCNLESDDCSPLLEWNDGINQFGDYASRGLLEVEGSRMVVTEQGRYLLPQMLHQSVPDQFRWRYPHQA